MDHRQRYLNALHAMQTGVAMELEANGREAEPKHLRVGVNSALCDTAALVKLCLAKGLFTEDEYFAVLADQMELEAKSYQERISKRLGAEIRLA